MPSPTEAALRAVVEAAVAAAVTTGRSIEDVRGVAFHDTRKDELFAGLGSFTPAVAAVSALPLVKERFGADEGTRLVLQFVFEYFERVERPAFVADAFDAVWNAFERELADPDWTYRGVANMRCFGTARAAGGGSMSTLFFGTSPPPQIDVADGVTIRGRTIDGLFALGFDKWLLSKISDDWEQSGFGHSSFVIVVEHKVAKSPENLVQVSTPELWVKTQRVLGALRLVAPGDVGIGPMWIARPSLFNIGPSGGGQVGFPIPSMGSPYVWTPELASPVRDVYAELKWLEGNGYGSAPGNLDLALRSFMATYDRWPPGPDSRLLDSIIALEAALGFDTSTEITFKLAFRVASLLARDDSERSGMLEEIKGFYDTRSKLVHGAGGLHKSEHQSRLSKVDDLRSVVRRILRAFVHLAVHGADGYTKRSFQQRFDAKLVNAGERDAVRRALGLT